MKLGIIGCGTIVREFLPGLQTIPGIEILAVLGSPGKLEKTRAFCLEFSVAHACDTLEELVATGIDAVYVAVPNHLHAAYAMQALELGLDVIVEKPMASNEREARAMAALAKEKDCLLLEAVTTLYSGVIPKIRQWLPAIGDVQAVECDYSQYSRRYDAFCAGTILPVFDSKKSGGALMDLNVYNLNLVTALFGAPESVSYSADVQRGIDVEGAVQLGYPGFTAVCRAAKNRQGTIGTKITGTQGEIVLRRAENATEVLERFCGGECVETACVGSIRERQIPEFTEFKEMICRHDTARCDAQLQHSLLVCRLMTQARVDAGVVFPADAEEP